MKKIALAFVLFSVAQSLTMDIELGRKEEKGKKPLLQLNKPIFNPKIQLVQSNSSACTESLLGAVALTGVVFIPSAAVCLLVWGASNF